jgi:probable LLM family oxidoreductase
MEVGLYSFGELTDYPGGALMSAEQRLKDLIEEIELADQVGPDVFGVGEHHRADYLVSAPAVVLAAAAARTKRIRLTNAVSVLSSDDPVRVFQQFATLDLLSGGRAEIMAGRGSFIESFPLFGYDLDDYDELFDEKLRLLMQLTQEEVVTWSGKHRAPISGLGVYPRPLQNPLPIWIAVGGTPQSVVRAATLGLPMALAIIGGTPDRFVPFVELYREAYARARPSNTPSPSPALRAPSPKMGEEPRSQISIYSHGYIADTSQQAADEAFPAFQFVMSKIGKERGWPPTTRQGFEAQIGPKGAVLIGSPQQVIDKILYEHELFAMDRFLMQMSVGTMPHAQIMHSIELFGTVVAPAVRKATAI